jgi:hypothetical protein
VGLVSFKLLNFLKKMMIEGNCFTEKDAYLRKLGFFSISAVRNKHIWASTEL